MAHVTTVEVPEGLLVENIVNLRRTTSWAYKIFSEVALLRSEVDSARAHLGTAMPILGHCRRILRNVDRCKARATEVLGKISNRMVEGLSVEARAFLDGLEHVLVCLMETIEQTILSKVEEIKARLQSCSGMAARFNQEIFADGKESVFALSSSLVEAADQIRRQLPKDWTIGAIMRHADLATINRAIDSVQPVGRGCSI